MLLTPKVRLVFQFIVFQVHKKFIIPLSKRSFVKRATIADIAARAGVSKSTVSHTLSGKRPISPATQRRIRAVIDEVGYRPSVVAQRLAGGGHSRTIGLAFPLSATLIAGTETEFIVNAANAASAADTTFLLLTHLEGNTTQFERMVESGLVDGFILMQVHMADRRVDLLRREGITFVLLGRCAHNEGLSFVDVDIEAGVAAAVAYLAGLGHRTVAYLPFVNDDDFGFAVRTWDSFHQHCLLQQITPISKATQPTLEAAEAACSELLQERPEISALLVRNKIMAEGVRRAAVKQGRQMPDDLLCIGMGSADNHFALPQGTLHLPWIDIRAETLAVTATQFLLAQLANDRGEIQQRLVTPHFIPGECCGALAATPQPVSA